MKFSLRKAPPTIPPPQCEKDTSSPYCAVISIQKEKSLGPSLFLIERRKQDQNCHITCIRT